MKRLICAAAVIALCFGGLALVGCESGLPDKDHNPYAGGTGVFGEDPVNPGEHARDRFSRDTGLADNPQTPPAATAR